MKYLFWQWVQEDGDVPGMSLLLCYIVHSALFHSLHSFPSKSREGDLCSSQVSCEDILSETYLLLDIIPKHPPSNTIK